MINLEKMKYHYKIGLAFGLLEILLTAFQVVFSRYSILEYNISPAVSIILALMVGSFVQLAYAGPGYGLFFVKTLKNINTWLYTVMQIAMNVAGIYILIYITTTEAFFIQRIGIIMSLLLGFLFLNRSIKSVDFIGIGLILFGIGIVLSGFDKVTMITVAFLALIAGTMNAGRRIIAEIHPIYAKTSNNLERVRCTGVITLVSSILFLIFIFSLSVIKTKVGHDVDIHIINWAPTLDQFLNKHNFYYGIIIGFFIIPLDTWAFFRANQLLKQETFIALGAITPFVILFTEIGFASLGLLDIKHITALDLIAGVIIVAGAVQIMYSRIYADKPRLSKQEKQYVRDAKVLALAGLEMVDQKHNKLANLLNINKEMLDNILNERAVLSRKDMEKIRNNFAKKIALFDSLTGLDSRDHFKANMRNLADASFISVIFLNIKDFSPINEQYGHEAGDELLQHIATRLNNRYPHAYITRFNGDDFCLVFANKNKYQMRQLEREVQSIIAQPYTLDLTGITLAISATVESKNYPEDLRTVKELLDYSEDKIYGN